MYRYVLILALTFGGVIPLWAQGINVQISALQPQVEYKEAKAASNESRNLAGEKFKDVPFELDGLQILLFGQQRPTEVSFNVSSRINAYLLIPSQVKDYQLPERWMKTEIKTTWGNNQSDTVYAREFQPGHVQVPLLPKLQVPVAIVIEPME